MTHLLERSTTSCQQSAQAGSSSPGDCQKCHCVWKCRCFWWCWWPLAAQHAAVQKLRFHGAALSYKPKQFCAKIVGTSVSRSHARTLLCAIANICVFPGVAALVKNAGVTQCNSCDLFVECNACLGLAGCLLLGRCRRACIEASR